MSNFLCQSLVGISKQMGGRFQRVMQLEEFLVYEKKKHGQCQMAYRKSFIGFKKIWKDGIFQCVITNVYASCDVEEKGKVQEDLVSSEQTIQSLRLYSFCILVPNLILNSKQSLSLHKCCKIVIPLNFKVTPLVKSILVSRGLSNVTLKDDVA